MQSHSVTTRSLKLPLFKWASYQFLALGHHWSHCFGTFCKTAIQRFGARPAHHLAGVRRSEPHYSSTRGPCSAPPPPSKSSHRVTHPSRGCWKSYCCADVKNRWGKKGGEGWTRNCFRCDAGSHLFQIDHAGEILEVGVSCDNLRFLVLGSCIDNRIGHGKTVA